MKDELEDDDAVVASSGRSHWMLVCTVENFEISRGRGFDLVGMRSRHKKKADQVKVGDKVIHYLAKEMAIGGILEIVSPLHEEIQTIWTCPEKPQEAFPYRFGTKPEIVCEAGRYVPVIDLLLDLEHVKRWPPEHWRLAFQGNVHNLVERDYLTIKAAIARKLKEPESKRSSLRLRQSSARLRKSDEVN